MHRDQLRMRAHLIQVHLPLICSVATLTYSRRLDEVVRM